MDVAISGIEDVYDIQVDRTENFIANGLVSHNTRWHSDDFGGRLERQEKDGNGEEWLVINFPAIAEEHDVLGRNPGDALWPQRYPLAALERIKANTHPYWFSAEYQQHPTPLGGGVFRTEWFRDFREEVALLPNGQRERVYVLEQPDGAGGIREKRVPARDCWVFGATDLAASTKTTADYTVCGVYAVTPDGDYLLLDVFRQHFAGPEQPEVLVAANDQYRPGFIGLEATGYQLTLTQIARKRNIPVRELRPDKDKLSRELTAATHYYEGRVYHRKYAAWREAWETELTQFPAGEHDDQADVAGYAGYVVETLGSGLRVTVVEEHAADEVPDGPSVFYEIDGWQDIARGAPG